MDFLNDFRICILIEVSGILIPFLGKDCFMGLITVLERVIWHNPHFELDVLFLSIIHLNLIKSLASNLTSFRLYNERFTSQHESLNIRDVLKPFESSVLAFLFERMEFSNDEMALSFGSFNVSDSVVVARAHLKHFLIVFLEMLH